MGIGRLGELAFHLHKGKAVGESAWVPSQQVR